MELLPRPTHHPVPRIPDEHDDSGLPVVASLAPLAAALAIWAVTRSPYALLFSLLGPVVAFGGVIDRRRRRRRRNRRERQRLDERIVVLEAEVRSGLTAEVDRLGRLAPEPSGLLEAPASQLWPGGEAMIVRLGEAEQPSGVVLDGMDEPRQEEAALVELGERTATVRAPVLVDLADGLTVVGPLPAAAAAARAIVLQLCARLDPGGLRLIVPPGEHWPRVLPVSVATGPPGAITIETPTQTAVLRWVNRRHDAPPGTGALIALGGVERPVLEANGVSRDLADFAVCAVSEAFAGSVAHRLRRLAAAHGSVEGTPPDAVAAREVLTGWTPSGVLDAPIGDDGSGRVIVDLAADGPHAVVGGTTGSGKSELLIAWVLAMAAHRPPSDVAFLLVDFKGGAAFAPLARLPHVVGTITDLDPATARRAALSLRAEMRRREGILADAGVPAIEGMGADSPPRLVVVIDEFAALVAEHPELHDVVGDLASRGRSLGIHLVLCTQRPGGVVRDAVLANAELRISLRVNNRGDSVALVGSDAAATLSPSASGRAMIARDGTARVFQVALADREDLEIVCDRWKGAPRPSRPWVDPPPAVVRQRDLGSARAFAVADLPDEQRLASVEYRPDEHGTVLVVGGRRSGVSAALGALLAAAGGGAVLPPSVPDAWAALRLWTRSPPARIIAIDDLDRLLEACDDDTRADLVGMLGSLAGTLARLGGALLLGARSIPSGCASLLSTVDSRLLLDLPDRERFVLAGGEGAAWRRRRPGAGNWNGTEVQLVLGHVLPPSAEVDVPGLSVGPTSSGRPLAAIVADDVERTIAAVRGAGFSARELGDRGATGTVVGHPDSWQGEWGELEVLRRGPALFLGCTPRDVRTLVRVGEIPPLESRHHEAWLFDDRRLTRVRLDEGWFAEGWFVGGGVARRRTSAAGSAESGADGAVPGSGRSAAGGSPVRGGRS